MRAASAEPPAPSAGDGGGGICSTGTGSGGTGCAAATTAAGRVYDSIYAAVLDHRLAPGTRLREAELADTFGVSRTVVRQALHQLAQEQVLVLRPNRGAQVSEPTRRDGEHVFDARRVVECEVVRRLAGRLTGPQLAALDQVVGAEDAAVAALDKHEAIRLSGQFHLQLAQCSGNPIFVRLLEALLPGTSLLMALYKAPGEPMCVAHSHRRLLDALRHGGAPTAAATEMRRHLNEIEQSLVQSAPRTAPPLRDVFAGYRAAGVAAAAPPTPNGSPASAGATSAPAVPPTVAAPERTAVTPRRRATDERPAARPSGEGSGQAAQKRPGAARSLSQATAKAEAKAKTR